MPNPNISVNKLARTMQLFIDLPLLLYYDFLLCFIINKNFNVPQVFLAVGGSVVNGGQIILMEEK